MPSKQLPKQMRKIEKNRAIQKQQTEALLSTTKDLPSSVSGLQTSTDNLKQTTESLKIATDNLSRSNASGFVQVLPQIPKL